MKKELIIASLLAIMVVASGCAISDYLNAEIPDKGYSLLTEKEDDNSDNMLDELKEELNDEEIILIEDEEESEEEVILEDEEDDYESIIEDILSEEEKVSDEEETKDSSIIRLSVKENEKVKLKPKAVDADEDVIIYSFSEPLDVNGEWQTDYGDAGSYMIEVTASDGQAFTSKKVLLTVERVNVKPVIEGVDSKIEIFEGETLMIKPKITDPNGDLVTTKISEPVGDDGVWNIAYQENGEYTVIISASDGELEEKKEILLNVLKKNVAPSIEELSDLTIKEGESIQIQPVVSDVNGDKIVVSISEPIGDDGEWDTGFTDNGEYKITVTATDGTATTVKTFKLTVVDVNKAPEILDIQLVE